MAYDVEKLITIVTDYLDCVAELKKYNLDIRERLGKEPDDCLWVPALDGSMAYRLGELTERENMTDWCVIYACELLNVDRNRLVSMVKSMRRWESHNGRWDRDSSVTCWISRKNKDRLIEYLEDRTE